MYQSTRHPTWYANKHTSDSTLIANWQKDIVQGSSRKLFPGTVPVGVDMQGYPLAPIHDILPLIQSYFAKSNRVMPLFIEDKFISMLQKWHTDADQRTCAAWAAINVTMAFSLWNDASRKSPSDDLSMGQCVQNAQSVLNNLVTRDQDLLGIQVVLGLVMLFQPGPNIRPALVLIAIAVKMAHRLRLHTRRGRELLDETPDWKETVSSGPCTF